MINKIQYLQKIWQIHLETSYNKTLRNFHMSHKWHN
jgi:hypothetical protein